MKTLKIKGFTIIELLAVVVVLGTILVISIPRVLSAIENSNKKAFEYSSEAIVNKLKVNSVLHETTEKIYVIEDKAFVGEKFNISGELPDSGTIYLNNEGKIAFTLFNDGYCSKKDFNSDVEIYEDVGMCTLVFSKITLIGDNPLYLKLDTIPLPSSYVEPGFIAIDEYGNNVPERVTITNPVDVNTIGIYDIIYVLKNQLDQVLDTVTRTVMVYDATPPTVTSAVATSNNIYNNKYVKNGEIVTLNLTFSKTVTDPTVTIGGRTATISGSGNTRIATYTIPAGEATLTNGSLNISISNFLDTHENMGETVTNVTSGGLVTLDNIKPTITNSVITSNFSNNKLAKNGSILTMSTTFSEPVRSLSSTLGGRNTSVTGLDTAIVTSNYTILLSESTMTEGSIVGGISAYMDMIGNVGTAMNINLSGDSVTYDRTAPSCVSSGGNATWTNGNRTITGTCSDIGGTGCSAATVTTTYSTDTNTTTASPGSVSDVVGNSVVCPANQTVRIDKTAPTCASSGGSTTWTNGNRTITGTCSDTGGSGCSAATVTNTYSTNVNTTTASPGSVSDNAGNSSACPANQTVRIDKTAPTCAVAGGSTTWTNGSRTVTGTCSDTGGSGCVGNISYVYSTEMSSIIAGAAGNGIGGSVSDNAGNSVACAANQTVRIDKTPPICLSSGGNTAWTNGNRTLTGTCIDSGESGCSAATVTTTFSSNINTTTASPGSVSDNAGNSVACPASQTVRIDKTPPICSVTGGSTIWTNGSRTVTGTCSDAGGSGCVGNISRSYSTEINTTTAGAAGNNVGGSVSDNAGNSVACAANQTVRIDKTKPTCSNSVSANYYVDGIWGTISFADSLSGVSGATTQAYSNIKTSFVAARNDLAGNSRTCTVTAAATTCYATWLPPGSQYPYTCYYLTGFSSY